MSEWKEYKLKDICVKITDGSHKSPKAQKTGFPMFSVKDMEEYGFSYRDCKLISAEDFVEMKSNGCVPEKDDILIAKDGSYLKQIFICRENKKEAILSSIAIFRPNRDIVEPMFLMYLIKSPQVYNYIKTNCVSGSAIPRIVLKSFKDVVLTIPKSIGEHKKIAAQLSEIDSKIECNRKICANLEAQAQVLFKHWFIDFAPFKDGKFVETELGMIPEGWKVGTLGDIAEITMGQSPSGSSYNEEGEGVVFYQGRTEFGFRFPGVRLYTTEPKRFAVPLSTLLSVRAPVGDINVATERCCIGRGLASINSRFSHNSFIYYLLLSLKRRFVIYNGEGTVFGSINKDTLNGLKIVIPPMSRLQDFEEIAREMDNKIFEAFQEINRLSTLRDTLLPKLMSGQIKL